MPADYVAVRDSCINRKKKKNGGEISEEQKKQCKKMAAIWYYRKHGKPVKHADAQEVFNVSEAELENELKIWCEQLDLFGSFEAIDNWNKEEVNGTN